MPSSTPTLERQCSFFTVALDMAAELQVRGEKKAVSDRVEDDSGGFATDTQNKQKAE